MTGLGDAVAEVLNGLFSNDLVPDLAGLARNVTIKLNASPVYDATTGPTYTPTTEVLKAIRMPFNTKLAEEVTARAGIKVDADTTFLIYEGLITEAALKPIKVGMTITGEERTYVVVAVDTVRDPTAAVRTNLIYKAHCREGVVT